MYIKFSLNLNIYVIIENKLNKSILIDLFLHISKKKLHISVKGKVNKDIISSSTKTELSLQINHFLFHRMCYEFIKAIISSE